MSKIVIFTPAFTGENSSGDLPNLTSIFVGDSGIITE